jgi:membrane protease YdiL (CAAX protease family)
LCLIWPYTGLAKGFSLRMAAVGLSGWSWLPFILYFTVVNPWLEEAYWRNVMGSSSKFPALVDFLFAGYHLIVLSIFVNLSWMVFAFLVLVAASWFWRQVSRKTGSLMPAVLAHMLSDLSLLVVLFGFAV